MIKRQERLSEVENTSGKANNSINCFRDVEVLEKKEG